VEGLRRAVGAPGGEEAVAAARWDAGPDRWDAGGGHAACRGWGAVSRQEVACVRLEDRCSSPSSVACSSALHNPPQAQGP